MKKLVVVADDFGLCESVNSGIARTYRDGLVTEVSLMLGSPGTQHALELIKRHNIHNVGIHLLLKHWRDFGDIVRRSDYAALFESTPAAEVADLLRRELAEFEKLVGHKPTHITSQYGIIVNPKVYEGAVAYAAKHSIPMRLPVQALYQDEPVMCTSAKHYMAEHGVPMTNCLFGHIMGSHAAVRDAFLDDLDSTECTSAEMLLHPGEDSPELQSLTSLVTERERDLTLALDPSFKKEVAAAGYKVVPYASVV